MLRAAASGPLPPELARHSDECSWCAESLQLSESLQSQDREPGPITVPAAGLIYWKAQLRARREQTEQAMRPARMMEAAALVGVIGVMIVSAAIHGSGAAIATATGFALVIGITLYVLRLRMD